MTKKEALEAVLLSMPDEVAAKLRGVVVPDWTDVSPPLTVDDAIIEQGRLAAMLNYIFSLCDGLPIFEIPMRIGQLNPSLIAVAAASLTTPQSASTAEFTVNSPESEAVLEPGTIDFTVTTAEIVEGSIVQVYITGADDFENLFELADLGDGVFSESDDLWTEGAYTVLFSLKQGENFGSLSVNFTIEES